ncbi:hypothetical protein KFK09_006213 [Dendrobium nobile]|uniref:Uncharacterized protein n=1 Tax=Dendrobium nobile TaxID=94219 RepID=A0A8T3BST4_DENNO|nr:hypothetical protein KFK09_006213 [Dendrobium nobile]
MLSSQPANSSSCLRSNCRNFRSDSRGTSEERDRTPTKEPEKWHEREKVPSQSGELCSCTRSECRNFRSDKKECHRAGEVEQQQRGRRSAQPRESYLRSERLLSCFRPK